MTTQARMRHWMGIKTRVIAPTREIPFRQAQVQDAQKLSVLMDRSYQGTIDHEGETPEQCLEEMIGTLSGKYGPFLDFASFVITEAHRAVSASLVTLWQGQPLLAFSMTAPESQGKGYAGFLIERSISALAEHGYSRFYLVVTEGNRPAQGLYSKLGFVELGAALPKQPPPEFN